MRARMLALVGGLWLCAGGSFATPDFQLSFTLEQQKFIANHPSIRVGITPEWSPFSYFTSDGKGAGIDVDVLNLISERTGLRFELIPGDPPWNEIWRMAKARELDLTTSTVPTADRQKVFHFTDPYAKSDSVIVARGGDLRFRHLSLLHKAKIAQPKDHLVTNILTNRLADAEIIFFDTQKECFEAVLNREADVAVADMFTTTEYMNNNPRKKLGISGIISEFEFPLALGVRNDELELIPILNKGLATISKKEMDAIISKHLLFTLQGGKRVSLLKQRLAYTLFGAAVIAGLFAIWHCFIYKEINARRAAEAELHDINRSLEIFSHSIAHDLRTPLRAISGLSEALQQDYGSKLDDTGQDYLKRIEGAAARMEGLVRDTLAYSQATRAEFKIENTSPKAVVHELLGEFPPEQRGFFHVTTELPTVRAHAALLAQCLANLFSNAIKFVPEGRTPEVRIWAERRDNRVRIWVADNGIGIAPEDQQRIFKLFERGQHKYGGTGIGLAVVAKGLERMNGSAGVESEPGKGSRFWIELEKAMSPETERTPTIGAQIPEAD